MGAGASKENAFPAGKTSVDFGLREKIDDSAQDGGSYFINGHFVYAERYLMNGNTKNTILFITFWRIMWLWLWLCLGLPLRLQLGLWRCMCRGLWRRLLPHEKSVVPPT